jgi:hypothetical protein
MQISVALPMKRWGLTFKWATLRFNNPWRKPGPAFNFMMQVDGAG